MNSKTKVGPETQELVDHIEHLFQRGNPAEAVANYMNRDFPHAAYFRSSSFGEPTTYVDIEAGNEFDVRVIKKIAVQIELI